MTNALVTDLYEVTMALSYLRGGQRGQATFSLFVRKMPGERGFLVAAGIESCLDFLAGFHIDDDDVAAMAAVTGREEREVAALRGMRFTGEVWAVPEGRIVLAEEPLIEVTAPLPQAQLLETYLLNQVTYQTAIASKAARCQLAAAGRPVIDFSLRRTQGVEAGMHAARLSGMVGFAATSNVAAAARYGIPASGTMAHSYVQAFPSEEEAFRAFAASAPGPVTFLVDTYDTLRGVTAAARVLKEIGPPPGCGIRLDSGDLAGLARQARVILDAAGLGQVRIIVSGGLDEYAIDDMVRAEAPIDVFAVGTKVGVSADHPYLDSAYKLVEYDGRPVTKLSAEKVTLPGRKQVHRRAGFDDVLATRDERPPHDATPLLVPVMREGRRLAPPEPLAAARRRFEEDLAALPEPARAIRDPQPPRARLSQRLARLTERARDQVFSAMSGT